ncbi:MAG: agmatine deiminase family protein [Prolixibacteraceae bacterium]|nr:agmatine deiminase family protein [Prolixibacteraceae bacterium]
MKNNNPIILPAEWAEQDGVMLTWPNENTDWNDMLGRVIEVYIRLATEIVDYEKLLIVCDDKAKVSGHFSAAQLEKITLCQLPYNDTWARDHGPLITFNDGRPAINDFGFNGWGGKFDAGLDNQITERLFKLGTFNAEVAYIDRKNFILEGGSVESDGQGTLLTTSACLLNRNRNSRLGQSDIENTLKESLGVQRILWLDHGHIEGDDTDSHIDTLARFCSESTIAYVQCSDINDPHYADLKRMEEQLKTFSTNKGAKYNLTPLPMVSPVFNSEGKRMGATYANFLIINRAVLLPVYGAPEDPTAVRIMSQLFPDRNIIAINCLPLIEQNGSLHCVTMQLPKNVLK